MVEQLKKITNAEIQVPSSRRSDGMDQIFQNVKFSSDLYMLTKKQLHLF